MTFYLLFTLGITLNGIPPLFLSGARPDVTYIYFSLRVSGAVCKANAHTRYTYRGRTEILRKRKILPWTHLIVDAPLRTPWSVSFGAITYSHTIVHFSKYKTIPCLRRPKTPHQLILESRNIHYKVGRWRELRDRERDTFLPPELRSSLVREEAKLTFN